MTPEQDAAGALYEHIMQDTDISRQSEQFRSEARRLAGLIAAGQSTFHALQMVDNLILREKLRPFIYATALRATVVLSLKAGGINQLQHDDLRVFLLDLVPSLTNLSAFTLPDLGRFRHIQFAAPCR